MGKKREHSMAAYCELSREEALLQQQSAPAPLRDQVYTKYTVWRLLDVVMLLGTVGLGICYAIARHLGHVDVFCDISDLVIELPERVLFRLNFALVGGLLAALAFPIHDVAASRVPGRLPAVAAFFQLLSGIGVILVGACGPDEIKWFHITAAAFGFGGSGVAQIIYGIVFYQEDKAAMPNSAKAVFTVRCVISGLFLTSAVCFGLGEAKILPEYQPLLTAAPKEQHRQRGTFAFALVP